MTIVRWSCIVAASLLGDCTSTSIHFHTLVPESARQPSAALGASNRVEVDPVTIPAQVDRLELVTRSPGGDIAIAEGDQWIAPVADELRNALKVELLHKLSGAAFADAPGLDSVSVRLNVERFESSSNRYALIEASWDLKLKVAEKDLRVVCRTRAYEEVSGGFPETVRGYQRAVALIADQIAAVARHSARGVAAGCPVS